MHAVVSTVDIDPARMQEATDSLPTEVIPTLRGIPGFQRALFLHTVGEPKGQSLILIDTEANAKAAAAMAGAPPDAPVTFTSTTVYEVVAGTDPGAAGFANVATVDIDPARMQEATDALPTMLIPILEKEAGFQWCVFLRKVDEPKGMSVLFYDTQANASAESTEEPPADPPVTFTSNYICEVVADSDA
jgi:hypothetical protein